MGHSVQTLDPDDDVNVPGAQIPQEVEPRVEVY
jgi:hypothetical protein